MTPELMEAGTRALAAQQAKLAARATRFVSDEAYFGQGDDDGG